MKPELERMLANMKQYNFGDMIYETFGFDRETVYDALVIAPGWKPTKIIRDAAYQVTQLTQHSYFSGYLVEKDGLKVAWAQVASGACNVLDHSIILAELQFRHLLFAGAVGSLVPEFEVGDFCTPSECIAGVYAHHYLRHSLQNYVPFETVLPETEYVDSILSLADENGYELRKAKVFCTDSIALEYSHLDEIKATGAQLIEMETSTFYLLAQLMEKNAVALLVVSDNSATGKPLLGRGEELDRKYSTARGHIIPDMIFKIAGRSEAAQ